MSLGQTFFLHLCVLCLKGQQCWVAARSCVEKKEMDVLEEKDTSSSLTLHSSRCPLQLISRITTYEPQVSTLPYMRQNRRGSTLVAVESQGKIFAIGGGYYEEGNFLFSRSVEVYNVETGQWSEANPTVVSCG